MMSSKRCVVPSLLLALAGCTPHDDAGEANPPSGELASGPAVVVEPAPAPAPPTIVAPALPELAPTRPLAHLDLLWTDATSDRPAPERFWTIGGSVLAITPDDAAMLGLAGPSLELPDVDINLQANLHVAGPLVIVPDRIGDAFMAIEIDDGEVAWQTAAGLGRSYLQFVSPRALVASVYGASGDALIAWALDDGHQLWLRSGEQAGFDRLAQLWSDGERGYLESDRGLEAFDPATGRTLWRAAIPASHCGVAIGEGVVVIEDPGGHQLLDASSGSARGRIGPKSATCAWNNRYVLEGVAPAVIAQGRLFAFDPPPDEAHPGRLRAFELASGRELWSIGGIDDDVLAADHDAVLVMRNHHDLVALAADTGKQQAELMIGSRFYVHVEPVGGAAGPWVLVEDDDAGAWILGRREQPTAAEDFELRGRLVPDEGFDRKRLAGLRIEVAGLPVKTDSKGRFVARGQGRGLVSVEQPANPEIDEHDWTSVGFDRVRVRLDGRGRYELGDIVAYEVSME